MNANILLLIKIIFSLLFLYSGLRFTLKYVRIFVLFMMNMTCFWNDNLDKPRILVHILFYPFAIYLYKTLIERNTFPNIVVFEKTLFCALILVILWMCHFTWGAKFHKTFVPSVKKILQKSLTVSYLAKEENRIEEIFEIFSDKQYLKGNVSSFKSMLEVSDKLDNDKIQWIHKSQRNPTKVNRQTLIEFLSILFEEFEFLGNKEIVSFCKRYFSSEENKEFEINEKNVSDWRNNKSKSIKEVSNLIKG